MPKKFKATHVVADNQRHYPVMFVGAGVEEDFFGTREEVESGEKPRISILHGEGFLQLDGALAPHTLDLVEFDYTDLEAARGDWKKVYRAASRRCE